MRVPKGDFRWNCQELRKCYVKWGKLKFSKFVGCFPRGCTFGDVDGWLEIDGEILMLEWKRPGQSVPDPQLRALREITRKDPSVHAIIVWGIEKTMEVAAWQWIRAGELSERFSGDLDGLREAFRAWSAAAQAQAGAP